MQSVAARAAVSAILLASALAVSHQSSAKLRRDGVLNLYPFPRVGRASRHSWDLPLSDLYLAYCVPPLEMIVLGAYSTTIGYFHQYKPSVQKRQLYAFPRVGRSDVLYQTPDRFFSDKYQMRTLEELLMNNYRDHGYTKRDIESTGSTSMWFGPRLGRSYKDSSASEPEKESPVQAPIEQSEPEQMDQFEGSEDRQKRQT